MGGLTVGEAKGPVRAALVSKRHPGARRGPVAMIDVTTRSARSLPSPDWAPACAGVVQEGKGHPPSTLIVKASTPMLNANAARQWPIVARRIRAEVISTSEVWNVIPSVKLK